MPYDGNALQDFRPGRFDDVWLSARQAQRSFLGAPMMIKVFTQIGAGQWFRYFTGGVEVIGAVLLLAPRTGLLGAFVLAVTMIGAVFTHLVVIGGSPFPAMVLAMLSVVVVVQLWPLQGAPLREGFGRRSTEA